MEFFDATNIPPQQGFDTHPAGKFDAQITNTYGKSTKDQNGYMLVIEFTTPSGKIESRYNLWNMSAQAVEIAHKELSALCHAVGVFRLPSVKLNEAPNQSTGIELRQGRLRIDVAPQLNKDGTPNDYMEVSKVYDTNGNEPGKVKAASQPQGSPPMQQNNNGGWGAPNPTSAPSNAAPAPQGAPVQTPGWGQGQPAPQQAQPSQTPPNAPPWAR